VNQAVAADGDKDIRAIGDRLSGEPSARFLSR
jgi:hypothetical protein